LKYFILAAILFTSCSSKFYFRQDVKVTEGFYKDCEGMVVEYFARSINVDRYTIKSNTSNDCPLYFIVEANYIKPINKE